MAGNVYDMHHNCEEELDNDPQFCEKDDAKHGCRLSCDFHNPVIASGKNNQLSCTMPFTDSFENGNGFVDLMVEIMIYKIMCM